MDTSQSFDAEVLLADLNWVQGLARSILGDAMAGDDVAQEAWLAALRRGEEKPSRAWLAGTVRNLAARWWRDQGRRGHRERQREIEGSSSPPDPMFLCRARPRAASGGPLRPRRGSKASPGVLSDIGPGFPSYGGLAREPLSEWTLPKASMPKFCSRT